MDGIVITLADLDLGPNEVIIGYVAVIRTHDPTAEDPRAAAYYVSSDVDGVLRAAMLAEGWRIDNGVDIEFEADGEEE